MAVDRAPKRRRLSPPEKKSRSSVKSNGSAESAFFNSASKWNLEQDYEQRPRKQKKRDKERTRLPIKTAEGRIEHLVEPEPETAADDADSFLASDDERGDAATAPVEPVKETPKVSLRQRIIEAKEELARIAGLLSEDPEEHAGSFRSLAQIADTEDATIKRLALVTQLAVYRDVIPGYRIRPLGEEPPNAKVSKDVRKLRHYEQSLVSGYQGYIQDLSRTAKPGTDASESAVALASVALYCACALVDAVPHFNFRSELLKILVDKLASRKVDADHGKCREALGSLFADDEDGAPSLEAVSQLTKMMKGKDFRVDESVLNTFLRLRLLSELSAKASTSRVDNPDDQPTKISKKKREFRTKKQRKVEKERKVIDKEMKEADATVSHEERDRMQSETLKLVFATYFRILKARIPSLMGAVLEGLAKYAHLINQDFFGDLLEALRDLINSSSSLSDPSLISESDDEDDENESASTRNPTRESLLCVITAFALLEGQDVAKAASTLQLDLSFFITHLYRTLYAFSLNPDIEVSARYQPISDPSSSTGTTVTQPKINVQTTIVILLRSLTNILLPRTTPPLRLAAFTKQLMTSSIHMPEKSTIAILGLLNRVASANGRKIAGLWNTDERKGDGVFQPLSGDVEGSNPFASTIWEGELLRRHYCPDVREAIKGLEGKIKAV